MKVFICIWPCGKIAITSARDKWRAALEFDCEESLEGAKIYAAQPFTIIQDGVPVAEAHGNLRKLRFAP